MFFPPRTSPSCCPAARAFTLIELLAVLAIVAILTSIVLGAGRRAADAGKIARTKAELAALSAALESYKLQHGDYPRTADNTALVQSLLGKVGPAGAPLSSVGRVQIEVAKFNFALAATLDAPVDPFTHAAAVLVDPWRQSYRYAYKSTAPWTNPSFVLYSIGPDGADGPTLLVGGYPDTTAAASADNLYANRN